jgi:hypothetical protein
MPTLVESQPLMSASIHSIDANDLDFTIPTALKRPELAEIVAVRPQPKKYRKNLILALEVSVIAVLILSCGGYAVYALLSLTK